jgi:hypothetical protein
VIGSFRSDANLLDGEIVELEAKPESKDPGQAAEDKEVWLTEIQ